MTLTLIDRIRRRRTAGLARRALNAALYGDYEPARRLIDRTAPHGPTALAGIAAIWCDAYLAAVPHADVELVTPVDTWLARLVTAHAASTPAVVQTLLGDVPAPQLREHLEALVRMAAIAQLDLDPDPVWP